MKQAGAETVAIEFVTVPQRDHTVPGCVKMSGRQIMQGGKPGRKLFMLFPREETGEAVDQARVSCFERLQLPGCLGPGFR